MKDSKYIDHTLLKAFATREQIANLCAEANKYDFKRVYLESFADTAKVTLAQILGIPTDWMYNV